MMTGLTGRQLVIVVLMIEAASALIAFAVLAASGQPTLGAIIGACILAGPFIIVPPTLWLLARLTRWNTLARLYPEVATAPDPSERRVCCMSVRWPLMNYNNVILIASDEDHLHLRFVDILSFGTRPVSIPWADVTEIDAAAFGRARLTVEEGPTLWVPKEAVKDELTIRDAIKMDNPAPSESRPDQPPKQPATPECQVPNASH